MSKIKFTCFLLSFLSKNAFAFTCTITTPTLVFPDYDPTQPTPGTTVGTISTSCDNNRPFDYTISMSAGSSGSFNPRSMDLNGVIGNPTINYNLYYNSFPPIGTIWGDGSPGAPVLTVVRAQCHVSPCLQTVYGSIPSLQNPPIGIYSANIVVQLNY